MKVFYPFKSLTWEYDYIKNDILTKEAFGTDVEFINYNITTIGQDTKEERTIFSEAIRKDGLISQALIKFYSLKKSKPSIPEIKDSLPDITSGTNILFVNHFLPFSRALEMIEKTKPVVIFHLSDEFGNQPLFHTLPKYTKLVFRQHNNKVYKYADNSYQMPLGYANGYLSGKSSLNLTLTDITTRKNSSAFIGQIKNDRKHMCRVFQNGMENTVIYTGKTTWNNIAGLNVSMNEMFDIYKQSKFILIGRGNASLDCFRFYEAILAGAIPVVVGGKEEIETTYNYHGFRPLMVSAETWENALIECKGLLKDPITMQKIQEYNLYWWKKQITNIQEKIKSVLT